MLKRVPPELSPYAYPYEPGFATAVIYDAEMLQIHQPTLYLSGPFVMKVWAYDAFPGSDKQEVRREEFSTIQEALASWEGAIRELEDAGFQVLLRHQLQPPTPVAQGYISGPFSVISAEWNPFQNQFQMLIDTPKGEIEVKEGVSLGHYDMKFEFLKHIEETFGFAPNVQL